MKKILHWLLLILPVSAWAQQDSLHTQGQDSLLQEVKVKTYLPGAILKGDTLIFNAEAYRLAEGSVLADLLKRLPGVEVDEEGRIKVRGRMVSEVKINGKDFFKGNMDMALKSLPAALIKKIKTYEEESLEQRHTGIRGREKPLVLNVELRQELKNQFTAEASAGGSAGKQRYEGDFFGHTFSDRWNTTLSASTRNTAGHELMEDDAGKNAQRRIGFNTNWSNTEAAEAKGKLDLYFSSQYDRDDNDLVSQWSGETFLNHLQSYTSGSQSARSKRNAWDHDLNFSWTPDERSWLSLSANLSWEHSRGWSNSQNTTSLLPAPTEQLINSDTNQSREKMRTEDYGIGLFFSHKTDSLGSTLGAWLHYEGGHSATRQFLIDHLRYYQLADSTQFRDHYVHTPSTPHSLMGRLSYSHHFSDHWSADAAYEWRDSHHDESQLWYALDSLSGINADGYPTLGWLPSTADSLALTQLDRLCRHSRYRQTIHTANLGAHFRQEKFEIRAELLLSAQRTRLTLHQHNLNTRHVRTLPTLSPRLHARWTFSPTHFLTVNYTGSSTPPSMNDLIDIPDESDPLRTTYGNPHLKNMWQHTLSLWWNHYNERRQRTLTLQPSFSQSFRQIVHRLTYDPLTGTQSLRPENAGGHWTTQLNALWSQPITPQGNLILTVSSDNSYTRQISLIASDLQSSLRHTMATLLLSQTLKADLRLGEQWDFSLRTRHTLQHSMPGRVSGHSTLTCHLAILQANATWHAPWHMDVTTESALRMRRGYEESQYNTTEWLCNATLSQSLLPSRKLSLGLRLIDIFHQRRCITRSLSATSHMETRTNRTGSYALFFLRWKFHATHAQP